MKQLILNSTQSAQTVVDYINAVNEVNKYASSIQKAQLPALMYPPANYGKFAEQMAKAKLHVAAWNNEVVASLNMVPTAFISFNTLIQSQFTEILKNLNQLKATPNDPSLIAAIKKMVGDLIKETSGNKKMLSQMDKSISTYQNSIASDAKVLQELVKQIIITEKVDKASIKLLEGVIAQLKALVDGRNELVTLKMLSRADLSLFLVAVGTVIGLPFSQGAGIAIGGAFGLSSFAFTSLVRINQIPAFQQSIEDIQKQMNNTNKAIGLMNSSVGLLKHLSDTLNTIVSNSSVVGAQMKLVVDFWVHLENDLNTVYADLNYDVSNSLSTTAAIDQAIKDVTAAKLAWNDAVYFMDKIAKITYTTIDPFPVPKH
ncbi:MAG: hypothetical protein JXR03_00180 [Cyclobacteriaceae bacterium]